MESLKNELMIVIWAPMFQPVSDLLFIVTIKYSTY